MNLFTYGTLMDSEIMSRVSGKHYEPENATLTGYRCRRIHNEMYPGIAPDINESISGVLYRNITPTSLHHLDLFEGNLYFRQTVQIQLADGLSFPADSYILKSKFHHRLSQEPWTLTWFVQHGKADFRNRYEGFNQV